MAIKTRAELKKYFKNGNVIKEQYFTNLIDSTLNQAEDNLENSNANGLMLKPSKTGNRFISFFNKVCNSSKAIPIFFVEMISGGKGKNIISFSASPEGYPDVVRRIFSIATIFDKVNKRFTSRLGVNTSNPEYTLDVNGTIGVRSISGNFKDAAVKPASVIADGHWHTIIKGQKGFKCFEISASVAHGNTKIALHGKTLFADGEHDDQLLSVPSDGLIFSRNHLDIRWFKNGGGYDLKIRTRNRLGSKPVINYKLTKILI